MQRELSKCTQQGRPEPGLCLSLVALKHWCPGENQPLGGGCLESGFRRLLCLETPAGWSGLRCGHSPSLPRGL